jgi:phosphate acetyltransferase
MQQGSLSPAVGLSPMAQPAAPTHSKYERLIQRAKEVPAAVHPCDESSLRGAVEAAETGIIIPILVGPKSKITSVAREHGLDIGRYEIVDVAHSDAAAARGVELIRESKGELLMKGSLHTDELMRQVTSSATGLRTGRRISHVFIMDVPTYSETLFITDAAINIFPDLDTKRDIIQNAVDLFTQVGLGKPRVAILSAVETVTSKIPSTIEAAALCKMAERGQITGAILDGPLAFDNAIDPEAAKIKGIVSPVAGRAQILVVPDLEAGNMLAKNLTFLAKADAAGIVLGARVPVILTSRPDSVRARRKSLVDRTFEPEQVRDVPAAIQAAGAWLRETQKLDPLAVGHRVVHGGPKYDRPVRVDNSVLGELERYVPLAPLHQPNNLAPIRSLLARSPELPQVACFDTAFHRGHTPVADHFAIPERLYAEGVRRYGFHGLSYEYVAERLRTIAPQAAQGRVIVAHLGSGSSMCALSNGRSVESTMGFTALDGLPMGTRPGQIDPSISFCRRA